MLMHLGCREGSGDYSSRPEARDSSKRYLVSMELCPNILVAFRWSAMTVGKAFAMEGLMKGVESDGR